jgi:Cof subfamily protein (haloacid dehalogenase superfamily)
MEKAMRKKDGNKGGLFLADVDGTLVNPKKELTRRALQAVRDITDAGLTFSIVSGRPPRGMKSVIDQLSLKVPCGAFNGAAVIQPDLTVIKKHVLNCEIAKKTTQIIDRLGIDYWIYHELDWYVRDKNAPHVANEQDTVHFSPKSVENFNPLLKNEFKDGVYKIVAVCDDRSKLEECAKSLNQELAGKVRAAFSQSYYLDITHPDANKGTLVKELCRLLSLSTDQVTTIGDMENDLFMFKQSRLSIAMGNSTDEVKKASDHVTGPNYRDGFAEAVEYLLKKQA